MAKCLQPINHGFGELNTCTLSCPFGWENSDVTHILLPRKLFSFIQPAVHYKKNYPNTCTDCISFLIPMSQFHGLAHMETYPSWDMTYGDLP